MEYEAYIKHRVKQSRYEIHFEEEKKTKKTPEHIQEQLSQKR